MALTLNHSYVTGGLASARHRSVVLRPLITRSADGLSTIVGASMSRDHKAHKHTWNVTTVFVCFKETRHIADDIAQAAVLLPIWWRRSNGPKHVTKESVTVMQRQETAQNIFRTKLHGDEWHRVDRTVSSETTEQFPGDWIKGTNTDVNVSQSIRADAWREWLEWVVLIIVTPFSH
jgi:hypothetical protein